MVSPRAPLMPPPFQVCLTRSHSLSFPFLSWAGTLLQIRVLQPLRRPLLESSRPFTPQVPHWPPCLPKSLGPVCGPHPQAAPPLQDTSLPSELAGPQLAGLLNVSCPPAPSLPLTQAPPLVQPLHGSLGALAKYQTQPVVTFPRPLRDSPMSHRT